MSPRKKSKPQARDKKPKKQPVLKKQSEQEAKKEAAASVPEKDGGEFPIVAVGASAGGLEAFTSMLQHLPPDTGMAFVYVQHLAPKHESMLTDILSRETKMPVMTVSNGMTAEPNSVYVIPPGKYMGITEGKLTLTSYRESPEPRMPIDYFMRSLANDRGGRSIGVVLSGTASDGTIGLMAIKGEGGITFAQDVKTAKYDGMPRSAVSAGCVDLAIPPEEIAREISRMSRHPAIFLGKPKFTEDALVTQESLDDIYMMVRAATGVDFSLYKPSTVKRRIKRRMVLHKVERVEDYIKYIRKSPEELNALYQDMLINVTSFFRDPESFTVLKEKVFPRIIKERKQAAPVRIWVPGCSTGEEVYSIAISFLEYLGDKAPGVPIQLFATDIDEKALEQARTGRFAENIAADVSHERLRRFFLKSEKGYQISKQIRDMCIFAKHNLVKDPPFSRMDIISCRNLLIYLGPVLQKKVFPIFHYALNPEGFLMLGSSETIGKFADLFAGIDKKQKIYSKKATAEKQFFEFAPSEMRGEKELAPPEQKREQGRAEMLREADRIILSKYAPPSLVVNSTMDVLKFSGRTGAFLEHLPGEASLNLMKMVREALAMELRKAFNLAVKESRPVRTGGVAVKTDSGARNVSIEVVPIFDPHSGDRNYLVIFEDLSPQAEAVATLPGKAARGAAGGAKKTEMEKDRQISDLTNELVSTKDYLQSIIEEQETTNEELRSANEEIQASNEELQSTNEELETAKEELQSANEELATVNDELENRNQELTKLNDDLNNLLSSVNLPIVILEKDLKISRFTPISRLVLNLIPTDVGRPISDMKPNINVTDLDKIVSDVIDTVTVRVQDVQDNQGRWYSLRVHPYMTAEKKVEGAVLLLIDIDPLKRRIEETAAARDYVEAIENTIIQRILVMDESLRIASASVTFLEAFGLNKENAIGSRITDIKGGLLNLPALVKALEKTVATGESFSGLKLELPFDVGAKEMLVSGKMIEIEKKKRRLILMEMTHI